MWVDLNAPGVTRGPKDRKMGLYGSHTCELIFQDAKVPADHIIGKVGTGFVTAMKTLDMGRLSLGAGCVGSSQFMLDKSIAYAKERIQFGKPIAKQQAVQFMLADMATEIFAARNMVYHGAWKADRGERFSMEAAMVKRYCSDMAIHVVDRALQIHGGSGFMKETGIERVLSRCAHPRHLRRDERNPADDHRRRVVKVDYLAAGSEDGDCDQAADNRDGEDHEECPDKDAVHCVLLPFRHATQTNAPRPVFGRRTLLA